jgi:ribosomal protein S18 acetylase RimI-like enzyme
MSVAAVSLSASAAIRRARPSDRDALADLLQSCWTDTYAPVVGASAVSAMSARLLTPQRLDAAIADEARAVLVAGQGDLLACLFSGPLDAPSVAVDRLYVAPQAKRRGLARALLAALDGASNGRPVSLTVVASNAPALAFYEAQGFSALGQSTFDFEGVAVETLRLFRPARLVIRNAEARDLDALVAIHAADSLGAHGDTAASQARPLYRQAFDRIVSQPDQELLVAARDGAVIGTAQLLHYQALTERGALRTRLMAVAVAPDTRGQGVGAALVQEARHRAIARGSIEIGLVSNSRRTRAVAFYRRLGFVESHAGLTLRLETASTK